MSETIKKTGKGVVVGAVAGVVAVAGIGAAVVFAVPTANNWFNMTFSKPDDYYANVLRKETKASLDAYAVSYNAADALKDSAAGKAAVSGNVSVEPGAALLEGLDIDKLNISCDYDYAADSENMTYSADLGISINSNPLVDISNAYVDERMYIGVPTISSDWLSVSMDDVKKLLESEGVEFEMPQTTVDTDKYKDIVSPEKVSAKTNSYLDIYLSYATNVTLEKNIELKSASGVETKYTIATVVLDAEAQKSMAKDILGEIKNDEDIKKLWQELYSETEDFDSMISDIEKDIDQVDEDLNIVTYIGSDGKIYGLSLFDNEKKNFISTISYVKGNDFALEMKIDASEGEYTTNVSAMINGTTSADKVSGAGTYSITENNENIVSGTLSYTDVDMKKLAENEFVGSINFSAKCGEDDVSIDVVGTEKAADCSVVISENSEELLKISVTAEEKDFTEITAPTSTAVNMLDEESLQNYVMNADYSKLKKNVESLRNVLGNDVTDEIIFLLDMITEGQQY